MSKRVGRMLLLGAVLLLAPAPPARASNDPGFAQQWGLTQIGAPAAWGRSTGSGVKVGIVDSGIDLNHEDFAGTIVASTACLDTDGNQAQCAGSAQDDNGHGTHVAGIAGARKDNGKGVAGTAPSSQLVVAKVFQETSQGYAAYDDDVIAGIKWVVDRGARVVNLSVGDFVPILAGLFGGDTSLNEGIDYAWSKGAVPVLSAGNTNLFGLGSANYGDANALIVGATGPDGSVSGYSSSLGNAKWGLVAPGGDSSSCSSQPEAADCILSTYWQPGRSNLYGFMQGTSMAAPFVSGAVADVFAANPGFSAQQAVDRVLGTLARASCGTSCKGRLDVANAVGAGVTAPPGGSGGGGGGTTGGSGPGAPRQSSAAPPRNPRSSSGSQAPRVAGATVPPIPEATTTTSEPGLLGSADYAIESDDLGTPKSSVRLRPDEDGDESVPAGVAALGGLGVLGAGAATAFVIRGRGGAAAVLEALRPGARP